MHVDSILTHCCIVSSCLKLIPRHAIAMVRMQTEQPATPAHYATSSLTIILRQAGGVRSQIPSLLTRSLTAAPAARILLPSGHSRS